MNFNDVLAVCISKHDITDHPFPNFFCYTDGWKHMNRVRTRERVEYLASRRNNALLQAIQAYPTLNHILMIDSYYVDQTVEIKQLISDYELLGKNLILGASTWYGNKFFDWWTTPEAKHSRMTDSIDFRKVSAVGACYIFPINLWLKGIRYGLPDNWASDYGCEHNYFCRTSNMLVLLDYNAKLQRYDIPNYSFMKRLRIKVGLRKRLLK